VDQPSPVATTGPAIWDLVIVEVEATIQTRRERHEVWLALLADMRERDHLGLERYGVRLQAHNGRNALVDAYQEALDAVAYTRQAMEERPTEAKIFQAHNLALELAFVLRSILV